MADFGSIVHYDGTEWRRLATRTDASLNGLWVQSDGEAWAAGEYGTILHRPAP